MDMTMTANRTAMPAENLTLTQVDDQVLALAADRPIWEPLYLQETLGRLHELMAQRRALKQNRARAREE